MKIHYRIVILSIIISTILINSCCKEDLILYCNQNIYIPDTALKRVLLTTWVPDGDIEGYLDANADGEICDGEAARIYELNVTDTNIKSIEGLGSFSNLKSLYCNGCRIESVSISSTTIELFECNDNQLKNIDISNMKNLEELSCNNNNLTKLDIPKNNKLRHIYCENNHLIFIDLSNANLWFLGVSNNLLTTIDLSDQTDLYSLQINGNQISSIDISKNPDLSTINIQGNPIAEIDFSKNPYLAYLSLGDNPMTFLDLSVNQKLRQISNEGEFTLEKICVWTLPFPPPPVDIFTNITLENFPGDFDGFVICE